MTCIVAWSNGAHTVMGADGFYGLDGVCIDTLDPKIVRISDELMIGVAGCVLGRQMLEHEFKMPRQPVNITARTYMQSRVAPAIRQMFHDAGVPECELLCVFRHELFMLSGLMEVIAPTRHERPSCYLQYDAIGSGKSVALGAGHVILMQAGDYSLRGAVETSLSAAARFDRHVRPPFHIEEL